VGNRYQVILIYYSQIKLILNLNQFEKLFVLVFNGLMSTEVNSLQNQTEPNRVTQEQKVDINILLNRVRHEKKKERNENILFLGLIGSVIVVTGIIASL
tara:strand:+ start:369 stop:665 length:297 start_codon:yes stop_codon:yes gene_type:complete